MKTVHRFIKYNNEGRSKVLDTHLKGNEYPGSRGKRY